MRAWIGFLVLTLLGAFVMSACSPKPEGEESTAESQGTAQTETHAKPIAEAADYAKPDWVNYEAGIDRAKAEGKYVVIDFWTGWCHWCKVMDKETYSDKAVLQRLAKHFIPVKVDAESRDPQGEASDTPSGQDLARQFQVNSYPTTWFVDSQGIKIAPLKGYMPPDKFILVLDYISSGAYTSQTFQDYQSAQGG